MTTLRLTNKDVKLNRLKGQDMYHLDWFKLYKSRLKNKEILFYMCDLIRKVAWIKKNFNIEIALRIYK